jgi:phosphatidylglycerol:prolipoprotein diacylglycerol transferase
MLHDFSPYLLQFGGNFGLRWYGFSYLLGFIFSFLIIFWLTKRQRAGLNPNHVVDFVTWGAVGVLIGGRLGFCVFYSPDLFISFRSDFPFWGVLAINEGGMASHGGILGLVVASWMFAWRHRINPLYLFDLIAVAGPIGIFLGRTANFINGELVGRPAPESFKWAVKFPQDILYWPSEEFAKLSSLSQVAEKIPGLSSQQWLGWLDQYRGSAAARSGIDQGLRQIIEAVQAGNMAVQEALSPLLTPRYPSQLFAAALEGLLIFLILFFLWYKARRPGVIGASFVLLYACNRIIVEFFRMPDFQIGYQWLGFTRGQWLSVIMGFVGIVLLFMWSRRDSLPIPGWGLGQNVKIGRQHRR